MILNFVVGLVIGFVVGALVYRNNAKHAEELLNDKRQELHRVYHMLDNLKKKLENV